MANILEVKNPVLKNGKHNITSDYKTRNPKRKNHNGIDFVSRQNNMNVTDYIIAIDDGVVTISKYSLSAGYYIQIKHNNGYTTRYLHLKKDSLKVKKGDKVKKGQVIGYMGNTGNSSGAHLHFDVHNGKSYVDPVPFLQGTADLETNHYQEFVEGVQRATGSKVDGKAGKETLSNTITVSAKKNRKHEVVEIIQKYLYVQGYTEVGKADGIAGKDFTKATKHYQKDFGCPVDGEITAKKKTWKKLLEI